LNTQIALPATQQQQVRLDPTKSGPGQFGYLIPPDGCNGASCLENWIAKAKPTTCYQKVGVDLNTGFKASVANAFNVRFDIWNGNLNKDKNDAAYAPALNVRKGFTATGGNWCNAVHANPYLNSAPVQNVAAVYPNQTTATATGDFTTTGSGNCPGGNTPPAKCVVKTVAPAIVSQIKTWLTISPVTIVSAGNVSPGATVSQACTPADIGSAPCSNAGANTLIMGSAAIGTLTSASMIVGLQTSGLPMDTNLVGNTNTFGNGQWDCDSYWRINHPGVTIPAGCSTPALTTITRYSVYLYENANNLINGYSLPAGAAAGGESGAPLCSGAGVGASTTQTDRRLIFSAVINCLANSGLITPGGTANNIPVAGFAKVFMTQPVGADGTSYIYGEMSGLVGSLDNVKILNQVQLYR
jgi:hypothetical protein